MLFHFTGLKEYNILKTSFSAFHLTSTWVHNKGNFYHQFCHSVKNLDFSVANLNSKHLEQ